MMLGHLAPSSRQGGPPRPENRWVFGGPLSPRRAARFARFEECPRIANTRLDLVGRALVDFALRPKIGDLLPNREGGRAPGGRRFVRHPSCCRSGPRRRL